MLRFKSCSSVTVNDGPLAYYFNPIALRTAKTLWSFDRSECNKVNYQHTYEPNCSSTFNNGRVSKFLGMIMKLSYSGRLHLLSCFDSCH